MVVVEQLNICLLIQYRKMSNEITKNGCRLELAEQKLWEIGYSFVLF